MQKCFTGLLAALFLTILGGLRTECKGDILLRFTNEDFGTSTVFNNTQQFSFEIRIDDTLRTGVYSNPTLIDVNYTVRGNLPQSTPSGFAAFLLQRDITGADFYNQGSSLNFEVASDADLSDGLQFSELVSGSPAFVLNAREVGTGRYHPPLIELNSDGTGRIQNSNNQGGVNPGNNQVVDVTFGEEYITDLTFTPENFTLIAAVPEPSSFLTLLGIAIVGLTSRKRR